MLKVFKEIKKQGRDNVFVITKYLIEYILVCPDLYERVPVFAVHTPDLSVGSLIHFI